MKLTAAFIALAFTLSSFSAADYSAAIQKALGGTKPDLMVRAYLDDISYANLERREVAYGAIKTPEDVAAWQESRRAYFISALGGFPERTPLNPRVVGSGAGEGFRYEKIIFESRPQFYVTAVLYLPVTDGPYPAVLVPCGHSANGKAAEAYQRACILLARYGIAALCYDPIGQGERVFYRKDDGAALGSTVEHTLFDVGAILTGTSIAQYRIWDGVRGIDYLQSRPDIIADKIGVTGNSGGGTLSSYLMALDDRIFAAAPSCYLTSWKRLLETRGPQDGEQNVFGQLANGLDHADFVLLRAPKPTLMLTATQDFFDIEGSWDTFRQAKRVYTRLGMPERVSLVEADDVHGFSVHLREGMVQWMRRWLLDADGPVDEVNFGVLSDADLQCTPTGSVMDLDGARSVIDLNVERAAALKVRREAFWRDTPPAEALEKVRELAAIRPLEELKPVSAEILSESVEGDYTVRNLLLTSETGIVLPARSYTPVSLPIKRAAIFATDSTVMEGDAFLLQEMEPDDAWLAVAVRGAGETENRQWKGAWEHVGGDFSDFMRAYLNGLSPVGMRTEDLIRTAKWWLKETATPSLLYALGESTPPALHAAALYPEGISKLRLVKGIPTWQAVVETPRPHDQLINSVHNALAWYDLDDLKGLLPEGVMDEFDLSVPTF